MTDQQLVRPTPISGFPEWLPEVRLVEQRWVDRIRRTFERYGFCSIETPAVESLDVLMAKGETSQEVYALKRLLADPDDDSDARLGLHFDLTVPFARYVAQHVGDLVFPFKRYQIQPVWRGERPQEGRYREFTQCDIDVVDHDEVPLYFDAELPRIAHEVLTELNLPDWSLNINNRKVLQGFYEGLGITDPIAVIRVADKLDKIGRNGVADLLRSQVGLSGDQVTACLDLTQVRGTDASVVEDISKLGVHSQLLSAGLDELGYLMDSLADLPGDGVDGVGSVGNVMADLSIARGLDYYTGTVYEAKFADWPGYGSICAGGRYENLVGSYIRRSLPGVGISIGLTRIFAKLVAEGLLPTGSSCPTDVLVIIPNEQQREQAETTAAHLRSRGINTELYHRPDRLGKQIRYASRKGIPYVWFPPFEDNQPHEIKDLTTGEQGHADPATWQCP